MAKSKVVRQSAEEVVKPGEEIVTLPLGLIEFRNDWNARKKVDETSDLEGGWDEFRNSIATEGQDTPIIVREHPKPGKYQYQAIVGFRRGKAIAEIAAKQGNKNPQIKAVVRSLDDTQARLLNMRENTARQGLSGADLCFGIKDLLDSNHKVTDTVLAQNLGKSQPYISALVRIAKTLPSNLLEAWRNGTDAEGKGTVKASYHKLEKVAKVEDPTKQVAAYNELAEYKAEGSEGDKPAKTGTDGMLERLRSEAKAIGQKYGQLVASKAIGKLDTDFFDNWLGRPGIDAGNTALHLSIPATKGRAKEPFDGDSYKSIVDAAKEGYKHGLGMRVRDYDAEYKEVLTNAKRESERKAAAKENDKKAKESKVIIDDNDSKAGKARK